MEVEGYEIEGAGTLEVKTIYSDSVGYSMYIRPAAGRTLRSEPVGTGTLTGPGHYKAAKMCAEVTLILQDGRSLAIRITDIHDGSPPSADFVLVASYPDLKGIQQSHRKG